MREQRVFIYSKEHQTNTGIKNTYYGLPTTVKVTKLTELLYEVYKNDKISLHSVNMQECFAKMLCQTTQKEIKTTVLLYMMKSHLFD
ncbi:hypothetical protein PR048_006523, partial [Dryococelus australis]